MSEKWILRLMVIGIVTLIVGVVALFFTNPKVAFGFIFASIIINTAWIVMKKENDKSKKNNQECAEDETL